MRRMIHPVLVAALLGLPLLGTAAGAESGDGLLRPSGGRGPVQTVQTARPPEQAAKNRDMAERLRQELRNDLREDRRQDQQERAELRNELREARQAEQRERRQAEHRIDLRK